MKKILQSLSLCFCALLFLNAKTNAQSTLLHYWNFNNLSGFVQHLPDITPLHANYSRIDTNKATLLYATIQGTSSAYSTYWDVYNSSTDSHPMTDSAGQSWNAQFNDSVGLALRIRNPSDSMAFLFYIPSTNYQNIVLQFVTETSSAGSGQQVQGYDYSTDSGATWKTTALSVTVDSPVAATWSDMTIAFNNTADTMVKNNPRLVFRVQLRVQNTGTSGNSRFDNVTVQGDSIIAPVDTSSSVNQVIAANNGYALMPNPANNYIYITSATGNARAVTIYNTVGQKVYACTQTGTKAPISVATLSNGIYYVNIKETVTGKISALQFVKQ